MLLSVLGGRGHGSGEPRPPGTVYPGKMCSAPVGRHAPQTKEGFLPLWLQEPETSRSDVANVTRYSTASEIKKNKFLLRLQ